MDTWNVAKYVALAVGTLVLVSAVVSAVLTLVGLAVGLAWSVLTLLAVVAVLYTLVRGALWLGTDTGGETASTSDRETSTDPVERVRDRYVDGALSEAELERRLELELDGPGRDEIDRELDRSRSS